MADEEIQIEKEVATMTDAERSAKISKFLRAEFENATSNWYYLSFAGEEGFRGCVIVNAFGPTDAIRQSHAMKINPGGEVQILEIPNDTPIPDEWKNKLLSLADMERLGMQPRKTSELEGK